MRNRFRALLVVIAVALGALGGTAVIASTAGASAADGISTGTTGTPGVNERAYAQGTNGGYNGYLGQFRAHAKCNYGPAYLLSYTITGPWVDIRGNHRSTTDICPYGVVSNVSYDRRAP